MDTHALLWLQDDNPRLSEKVKSIILDRNNKLHLSIASFWEITIKKSLGKLVLGYSLTQLYHACITSDIIIIPIELTNLNRVEELPFHHKDPFDRLIAAIAIDNDMTVITLDENVSKYPVHTLW